MLFEVEIQFPQKFSLEETFVAQNCHVAISIQTDAIVCFDEIPIKGVAVVKDLCLVCRKYVKQKLVFTPIIFLKRK